MDTPQHFSFPLRLGRDGSMKTVEQDTPEDIVQCVEVILATPIGSRLELPAFGIPILEFGQPVPIQALVASIYTWEPRAAALVSAAFSDQDELQTNMTVEVLT